MGDVYRRDATWWRRGRISPPRPVQEGSTEGAAALAEPLTRLVVSDESAMRATMDLEGRLGIFIETVAHPSLVIGSRICLRVRKYDFPCVVVSVTRSPNDVVCQGLYLALEDEPDLERIAYYFATREAVFFDI